MTDYNSDLHLSRWRRIVIWFCEDNVGHAISIYSAIIALGWPVFLWRWWIIVLLALGLGFAAGYNVARSFWKSEGHIPKL